MNTDEMITGVAREMTNVDPRPNLRAGVMTHLDATPRSIRRGWARPVMATGAMAAAAVVWLLLPASGPAPGKSAPVVAQQTTPSAPAVREGAGAAGVEQLANATRSAPYDMAPARAVARSTAPRIGTAASAPVPVALVEPAEATPAATWASAPSAETPMLPPLDGPPPIVIDAITWDDVVIAPLTVELIEVAALTLDPVQPVVTGGV